MGKKPARKKDAGERETDGADRSAERTRDRKNADALGDGYVEYERGPDPRALSERYGMEVRRAEAGKLQRLESEFGRDRVQRWAEEGMSVETMGNPRDMEAFRKQRGGGSDVVLQPKLEVSSPDDPAEREAERVAEEVVEMDGLEGQPPADETEEPTGRWAPQKRATLSKSVRRSPAENSLSDEAEEMVQNGVRGGGKPLSPRVQSDFEARFGVDFSGVRVHTGTAAAEAARSINAEAYTLGSDIAFANDRYNPGTETGNRLLAHELTHVAQSGGRAGRRKASSPSVHRQPNEKSTGWVVTTPSGTYPVSLTGGIASVELTDEIIAARGIGGLKRKLNMREGTYTLQQKKDTSASSPSSSDTTGDKTRSEGEKSTSGGSSWGAEDSSRDQPTVTVLEQDGSYKELPLPKANLVGGRIDMKIRGGGYGRLNTALAIWDGLQESGEGVIGATVQFYSEVRGGAEEPDIAAGKEAMQHFKRAMNATRVKESHGNKYLNLQRAHLEYQKGVDPAQRVSDQIYAYRNAVIKGAESGADDMRIIRDVSFTVSGALATGGAGAAAQSAGWSTGWAVAAQAGAAGTSAAVSEGFKYSFDEVVADPSKEFSPGELSTRMFKEFVVSAVTELAAGKLRKYIRAKFNVNPDFGAYKGTFEKYAGKSLDGRSIELAKRFVKQQGIELIGDLGADFINRFIGAIGDTVCEILYSRSKTSIEIAMQEFAKRFANYNPFKILLQSRIKKFVELEGEVIHIEGGGEVGRQLAYSLTALLGGTSATAEATLGSEEK